MKEDDVKIIVINFAAGDIVMTNALQNISSSGYYYISTEGGLTDSLAFALTQSKLLFIKNLDNLQIHTI